MIELRRRPRWKRVLRMPRAYVRNYRILRRHNGRWDATEVAARLTWLLW